MPAPRKPLTRPNTILAHLDKLQDDLRPKDLRLLKQLAKTVEGEGRLRLGRVIPELFPDATPDNAKS